MTLHLSTRITAILHFSLSAAFLVLTLTQPAPTAAQGESNNRFGLVNAYQDAPAARASGAGWEIVTLRWDELQPGGPTDWTSDPDLDEYLSTARTAGREVVGLLIGTPGWATNGSPATGVPRGLYLPVSDPGNVWAGFVKRAASYYGSRGINRWVIWRNPDIPPNTRDSLWEGSIEEYYQLVKVAYISSREANPNALIHLGGVGEYDPNWFSRFLDLTLDDPTAPGNNYYFDVATLHIYNSPERVYTLMRNHFYLMDQKGIPLKEVWLNETNARPAVDPDVYPEDAIFREHPRTTQEQQATFIIQSYAMAFAANRGARVAVYRLVDNLEGDANQAFGLVRADGTIRPAYTAYQVAAEQFNGFVYARRVEEETHPLIDYVRLTFATRVTHVIWAITDQNATLVIPARTQQATLIDMSGNRWAVQPEGGYYRVAVAGADCNDPAERCMIGGAPWLLVEDDIPDAANAQAPAVTVEAGGTPPTPDPSAALTATAQAAPTATPTVTPTQTPEPTQPAPTPAPTVEATIAAATTPPTLEATSEAPTQVAPATEEAPPIATADPNTVRPSGVAAILPYALIALGALVMVGGAGYFWMGRRRTVPAPVADASYTRPTDTHERPELPPEEEAAALAPRRRRTRRHKPSSEDATSGEGDAET